MRALDLASLQQAYRKEGLTVHGLLDELLPRIAESDPAIWVTRVPEERLREWATALEKQDPPTLPLYGVPFAIKDNIDLAGLPTTAACPGFAYTPEDSAFVVEKLLRAGALPVGKTNLDQFATGLVGTRSPYGVPGNAFDAAYIPGGSSSGSAVAVAKELVTFSLGTDTAGSGRVPASFNNLVGLKPTRGLLSCRGVVPACRSLDCVSIFVLNASDAAAVLQCAASYDSGDAYARLPSPHPGRNSLAEGFVFGVPAEKDLEFFGDDQAKAAFFESVSLLEELSGKRREIDFTPFAEAARLLYEGPWVAERTLATRELLDIRPEAFHPVTRTILEGGRKPSAMDAFAAQYRLQELRRRSEAVWKDIDVLVTPTAPTIYKRAEVEAEPVLLNSRLGIYTNYMNLLDLSACAVPSAFRPDGMPAGVTLVAPAFSEAQLLTLTGRLHAVAQTGQGAARRLLPSTSPRKAFAIPPVTNGSAPDDPQLVVCGAHMRGAPLSHQLSERGGVFVRALRTASAYRLYALPPVNGLPARPGLVRVREGGAAIEAEVWTLPSAQWGSFLAGIAAPLGLGTVMLEDGTSLPGFLCEAIAGETAEDITALGSWRDYIARLAR